MEDLLVIISVGTIVATLALFFAGLVYICTLDSSYHRVSEFVRPVCFDYKSKQIISSIDSRYSGTLAVFIISSVVWIVADILLVIVSIGLRQEYKEAAYNIA